MAFTRKEIERTRTLESVDKELISDYKESYSNLKTYLHVSGISELTGINKHWFKHSYRMFEKDKAIYKKNMVKMLTVINCERNFTKLMKEYDNNTSK